MTAVASRSGWAGRTGWVRFALPVLAVGFGAMSASLAEPRGVPPTSYAATSTAAAVFDLAAGLSLLTAGAVAVASRLFGSIGPLTVAIGVAWFASDWVSWAAGPSLIRGVAVTAAPFVLPLVVHLGFAFPVGRVTGRAARAIVASSYGVAAVVSVGRAVASNPFLDQYCWRNCTDNVFLVHANLEVMRFLKALWLGSSVGVGLLLCVVCCWRLVRTTPVARAKRWHVLVPVALVAIAEVAYAGLLSLQPAEDPERIDFASVFFARAGAVTALAVAVMWAVVRAHRTRWAVARLAEQLGDAPTPGSLKAALARSLGDGSLEVAYWLPGGSRYVDAAGHAMNPRPGRQQMATAIVRDSQQVALVIHDRGLRAAHDLEQKIGPAARLAVDNERLRAAVLAQLHGLRASRARIVETADATRRRLERNLHDGAQQRLLAVSYELRLASAAAGMDGKLSLAPLLTSAAGDAQKALAELRELAHGIFPAILTEAGLRTALSTLADHASVAVVLPELVDERYPPVVETAAYLVVAEAVGDAARRSATYLIARVFREGGNLVIEVNDDGELPSPTSLIHVADRVGAIGGHLDVGADRLRAEIPCG